MHVRHRWSGWIDDGALSFISPAGTHCMQHDTVVLALGGGSWPQLGSDAAWVPLLEARGVSIAPLRPANCGFNIAWSTHFRERFAGHAVKPVVACCEDARGVTHRRQGELVVTANGLEGGLIYTFAAALRDALEVSRTAVLELDLAPGWEVERLRDALAHPRGSRSLSSHVQSRTGLRGVKMGLIRERLSATELNDPQRLASAIKALPIELVSARPIEESISTAGGVRFEALDENLMLREIPGVFCAGEMLDWEAPTGGYLLTACLATGRAAGEGVLRWLERRNKH
jgi:uncharacterized flavoprotein (TIGR03862 family)